MQPLSEGFQGTRSRAVKGFFDNQVKHECLAVKTNKSNRTWQSFLLCYGSEAYLI
jgi:hypothetical protein